MSGKVWLVGAGPGDAGLLTLRAREVLEQAEVVVYDALVGKEVLALLPPSAERIYVGKRAGHHSMGQPEIGALLSEKARAGYRVARLKGGDPFLFGRGGEELELLAGQGIPCEVVPGVSSALAVPACAGIPVTHRDWASSVHIVTGHRRADGTEEIPYRALVKAGGTLVFLMGVTRLPQLCEGLMDAGLGGDTPAAMIERGTLASQRVVCAELSQLPRRAAEAGIRAPAVLVVGAVCALRETLRWREALPLSGCRVLVTRPRRRQGGLAAGLRALGAEVVECPTVEIVPVERDEGLEKALDGLSRFQWLAFTSPSGVEVFLERLRRERRDLRALSGCRMAALGGGTAAALEARGFFADLVPETYDAVHLGEALLPLLRPGDRVLLPRARRGNPALPALLRQAPHVEVADVPLYDTVYCAERGLDLSSEPEEGTLVLFTSASTVEGFLEARGNPRGAEALCIGRETARRAEAAGMRVHVAEAATVPAMIELVKRVYQGGKNGSCQKAAAAAAR